MIDEMFKLKNDNKNNEGGSYQLYEKYCYNKVFVVFYSWFSCIDSESSFEIFNNIMNSCLNSFDIKLDQLKFINKIVSISLCYVFCSNDCKQNLKIESIFAFIDKWFVPIECLSDEQRNILFTYTELNGCDINKFLNNLKTGISLTNIKKILFFEG